MNAKQITFLVLLLATTSSISRGQTHSAQAEDATGLFTLFHCKNNVPSDTRICSGVLPATLDTKTSKAGDHVLIKMVLSAGPLDQPIAALDAVIAEVQPATKGRRSMLRVRIDRAISQDRRELPIQTRVLAIASQSNVTDCWHIPFIVADRFSAAPEDEQRLPGEKKFSADQRRSSPLDATPDLPVLQTMICAKKAKKSARNTCTNLLDAHGIYGYGGVDLEPRDNALPSDSVLTSRKNILLPAGTIIVLEVKKNTASLKN